MKRDSARDGGRPRSGRPQSQRQLRVGEEVRHALAWTLEEGNIRDPDLAGAPVTITEVRVSPDLRNATVFCLPLGGDRAAEARMLDGLRRVRPFLRHEVAARVRLRHVPDLTFEADTSFDTADRIDALLHSPEVARDVAPDPGPDPGPDFDSDARTDGENDGDPGRPGGGDAGHGA